MWKKIHSLQELKRKNYLFILPGVFIATVAILFMQIGKTEYTIKFYAHIAFIIAFIIGWILAYKNHKLKFFEYFMLILVYIYHLLTIMLDVIGSMSINGDQGLGTFIIWLPLIIIYTFTVLTRKRAILASIILLIFTMIPGVYYYFVSSTESMDSLTRIYLSTAVYSVILLFAYQLIRTEIEVQVMRRQLLLDPLTQVGNRYQIDKWLNKLIEEEKESFSLLFLDIDYFKTINDQFGHKIGDDVLKELTGVVQAEIEEEHYFGRWGGEEFIIIINHPECEAFNIAERIREKVEAHEFKDVRQSVTISVGVTEYIEGDTTDSILIRADERLYLSKDQGRNQVTGRSDTSQENLEMYELEMPAESH